MWRYKLFVLIATMLLHVAPVQAAAVVDPSASVAERTLGLLAPSALFVDGDCFGPARPLLTDHKIMDGMELNFDHSIDYSLDIDAELSLIMLRGTLQIGVARALGKALFAYPCVTGIVLDSDGGNVYQTRAMASLVLTHELETYVRGRCHSACALVFVAGTRRFLAKGASIGFHCYRLNPGVVTRPGIDPVAEQKKDFRFFVERIPDVNFARSIFRCYSPGLWLPAPAELLEAGVAHEILRD